MQLSVEEMCVGSCELHARAAEESHLFTLLGCEAGWCMWDAPLIPVRTNKAEAGAARPHHAIGPERRPRKDNFNVGIPDVVKKRVGSDRGSNLGQKMARFSAVQATTFMD